MKQQTKKYSIYIFTAIITCHIASCKKLLEIPSNPADRISTEQAFSDSTNVVNVISGIYHGFEVVDNGFPGIHNGALTVYGGLSGDELINKDIFVLQVQTPFYTNTLLPTNALLSGSLWEQAYKSNYRINAALEGIDASPALSPALKQRLTGELKTLRALYYFNMVNLFGGVPLVTETNFRTNARLPRATVEEVYEQIVEDLEEAQTLLTPEYPSDGHARPNLYAAKALLAKVYLYLEEWQKAANLSGEVIDAGLYGLETDLNNVFLHGSTEAIWQYPTDGAFFYQTNEGALFLPSDWDLIPKFELTASLLNDFETDDQRKINWVTEVDFNGTPFTIPFKYKNNDPSIAVTQEDYMILRLGEQYLIRAEARAQLNMFDEALEDLNAIRTRAGLPDISFTGKETLLAAIMQERRIELFCEWGNRWFDVKRTGQANTVFDAKPNWQPTDALYPIPLTEIQTNPFLTQNPGY